jgi:hypothetical protein
MANDFEMEWFFFSEKALLSKIYSSCKGMLAAVIIHHCAGELRGYHRMLSRFYVTIAQDIRSVFEFLIATESLTTSAEVASLGILAS